MKIHEPNKTMKTINTLEDAFVFELESLYSSEKKLKDQWNNLETLVQSQNLRETLCRYIESCDDKMLKIERALSYVHREPKYCRASVVNELIHEFVDRLKFAQDPKVQEQMLINCMESIVNYKTCAYEASLRYAEELDLDVPADLLLTIIQCERKMKKELVELSFHEFNKERHFALN
jgi:ferritin-like metal-binding protein YciE